MLRTSSLSVVDDYRLHFIFDGGTLRLADKAVNMFGPLTFKNATIEYQGGWGGTSGLGIMHMTGDVTVQGTQPVTLPPATEYSYLYLNTTNFVVDVEEPQGLFTIGLTVQHAISTPVNFTKRGAGTVCFASPNPKFNAYRKYIDGKASSACELVYNVIDREEIDAQIAQALYVGIVTDTGVFQYSNTSESTMRAAGSLMSYGFDHTAVIREVFFERTPKQARVLGTALIKAEPLLDGKLILCCFDKKTMDELGAGRKDLDGISAQLLLNSLDRIAPPPMHPEILMQKGRFLAMQKNGALARTHWGQLIQLLHRGDLAEQAYYLSMLSLARDGKWQDADAMLKEFRESFPDSIWLARLPETFKGYKVPAIACK